MIRPININLNAAHPELPLVEATTFTGAPSSVFIRGVPKAVGNWSITAVSVAVTYPDNTTTARAAVESAEGVWVATIPGTATSGRTAAGFKIMADGIDENGAAVTGYVLGFADFSVRSFTPVPAPGGTFYLLRYFDQAPATPKEGDVAVVGGILKYYNGTAWLPFGIDDYSQLSNKPSINDVTLSGNKTAAQLGLATQADATLTERGPNHDGFSAWTVTPSTYDDGTSVYDLRIEWLNGGWCVVADDPISPGLIATFSASKGTAADTTISWVKDVDAIENFTATRTALQGYQLGSQTDKPVASEAEAEALRNGKLDKSGGTMTGTLTIAEVDGGGTEIIKAFLGSTSSQKFVIGVNGGNFYIGQYGHNLWLPYTSGTLALTAGTGHTGNLAALDANGNPTDAGWTAGDLARYALTTKTIDNGAVTLDDRASNSVTISATLSPNTLTINFPTATSGKVRDFAMRLNIAAGVTAPEIAWPQGVTLENNGGEVPEIADGGTGGSSTILYFSETENNGTTAKFLVKGETLTAIAQA